MSGYTRQYRSHHEDITVNKTVKPSWARVLGEREIHVLTD